MNGKALPVIDVDGAHLSQPGDWTDIAVFLAVLDAGNLVAAADTLGMSQPTVGRRIAALESRMGTHLFARTGRRMLPTEVGRNIEESARKMAREMHAIQRTVTGAAKGLHGQVTISALEGTGSEWLLPVLASLQQKYPDIFVELKIEARAADLVQREADIALRLGRPTQLDLISRKLATVGFGIYAATGWLKRHGPIRNFADLNGTDWVRGAFSATRSTMLQEFFQERGLDCRIALSTNSPAAQLRAVQHGIGLGVLSHRWVSRETGLERVLPAFEAAAIDLWLVTHEDLRHSARIKAVADHIAEAAHQDARLFASGETR
jgi:DNA-binding transcriptional LysR family regulator